MGENENDTEDKQEFDLNMYVKKHPFKTALAIAIFLFYLATVISGGSIVTFLMATSALILLEAIVLFIPNDFWEEIIDNI